MNTKPRENWKAPIPPVRSNWNTSHGMVKGLLTDQKIARYELAGWYAPELKTARRELAELRRKLRDERSGNFISREGRLIYCP